MSGFGMKDVEFSGSATRELMRTVGLEQYVRSTRVGWNWISILSSDHLGINNNEAWCSASRHLADK